MTHRLAQGTNERVVWQAASLCLGYPDAELASRGGVLRRALAEAAPSALRHFTAVLELLAGDLAAAQTHYIDLFDLSRKHTLYLTYWTDGDTRRRGESLAAIKQRYRRSSFLVNTGGELPDFLPMALEYAALADPRDGAELLQEYRRSLELIRLALAERSTPYAGVLVAVCNTLPGASPADRATVLAMAASAPPVEQVGLEAYDPRLLPLAVSSGRR